MHARRNELPPLVAPEVAHDFVWVDDVVEALVLAAEAARRCGGSVYNVGTGVETSLAQFVEIARRVLDIDAEPTWGSMTGRAWDATSWVADNRRIQTELGWQPRTDLAEGLRRTAAWLQARNGHWQGELVAP
jgi:nucleoside-diphosphate-sugar epimerase